MMHSRRKLVYRWVTITIVSLSLIVAIDVLLGERRSDIEYLMWAVGAVIIGFAGSFGHDRLARDGFFTGREPRAD